MHKLIEWCLWKDHARHKIRHFLAIFVTLTIQLRSTNCCGLIHLAVVWYKQREGVTETEGDENARRGAYQAGQWFA